jgi:bacterioferritin-associated ferredoxin
VFIAGDGASVAGAEAAEACGRLVVLAVANALGRIDARARDEAATEPRRALDRATRGRRFFDTLYRPAHYFRIPRGDTVVCRCEQVTAREIVEAVAAGCPGPNQMKAYLRCGMGPCQGHMCGLTVTEIIARERKLSPSAIGYCLHADDRGCPAGCRPQWHALRRCERIPHDRSSRPNVPTLRCKCSP